MLPAATPSIAPVVPRSSPLIPAMIPINTALRDSTLSPIPQSPLSSDNTPIPRRSATIDHSAPATRENDYFSLRTRRPSVSQAPPPVPPSPDDFGSWGAPGVKPFDPNAPVPTTPSGLMGRLKAFGKGGRRAGTDTPVTPGVNQTPDVSTPAVRSNSDLMSSCSLILAGYSAAFATEDTIPSPIVIPVKSSVLRRSTVCSHPSEYFHPHLGRVPLGLDDALARSSVEHWCRCAGA